MAFLPSNSFMRFELGANVRVRRRLAAAFANNCGRPSSAAFGFTCHKMHVSLKELRSGTANWRAMTEKVDIKLNINGHDHAVRVEPRKTLVDVIRDECGLTGTHIGCEHGICGACTVILDNEAVRSCLMFAVQAQGKRIRTVEGLADGDKLHPVQSAFIEHHALQCGFCTPGFLMLTVNALETNPDLTDDDILDLLSSNLCRCTGYQNIVKAVRSTVTEMRRQAAR
jgi:aerobic carbon-monoxide dehydrogenase small subunit